MGSHNQDGVCALSVYPSVESPDSTVININTALYELIFERVVVPNVAFGCNTSSRLVECSRRSRVVFTLALGY